MLSKAVVVLTTTAARAAVMPVSALNSAKRAFVTVLLSVASTCSVKVKVNRDSKDKDLLGAYRQVVKKAHPDKGGDTAKFQRLQAAKEAWAAECQTSPKVGAPSASADDLVLSKPWFAPGLKGVRVRGQSVLLDRVREGPTKLLQEKSAWGHDHKTPLHVSRVWIAQLTPNST